MNVLLAAEEAAGLRLLKELVQRGHRLTVMATPPGEGDAAPVWNVAGELGCERWPAARVREAELAERIRAESIDVLLNVHSLHIAHPLVLQAPRLGAFNLHPGPLPRYAGLNAVSWAIWRGEARHGVTLHHMVGRIDAGDIVYEAAVAVEDDDTALSLSLKCVRAGLPLVHRLVEQLASDAEALPRRTQDLAQRQYFGRGAPNSARIHWGEAAERIRALVRACDYGPFPSPWGRAWTTSAAGRLEVLDTRRTGAPCDRAPGTVVAGRGGAVLVATGDEWLALERLRRDARPAPARELVQAEERLGAGVGSEPA